ncbi:MAG: hypothetical protein K2G96_03430, partial [Clostridia bacterium]|nr:hypothetical protein [Clostridia bacterium]
KLLANLYALRAGLSAISQEYDKAQKIENDCGEKFAKTAKDFCEDLYIGGEEYPELSALKTRYGYKWDLSEEYNAIKEETKNNFKERITKQKALRANNDDNARKAYGHWLVSDECDAYFQSMLVIARSEKDSVGNTVRKVRTRKSKRETRLSIIFFSLAAILAIIIAIGFATMDAKSEILLAVLLIIALIVFLILGIVYMFKSIKSNNETRQAHNNNVLKKETALIEAQSMLDKLPEAKATATAILRERNSQITPLKQSCNDFYMALKKQFNSLLDERDWQNLDLVIYELETRRADNVKEALQLVDRELQTERIQQTIALATEQICYEIRRGFAELKETIIECSRVISAQLSAISMQLNDMGGQLADLCDSVNMSNALQAKANVTSAQLLSDVHAIRYYQ